MYARSKNHRRRCLSAHYSPTPLATMPNLGQTRSPSRGPLAANHPQPTLTHRTLATDHAPNKPEWIEGRKRGSQKHSRSDTVGAEKKQHMNKSCKNEEQPPNRCACPRFWKVRKAGISFARISRYHRPDPRLREDGTRGSRGEKTGSPRSRIRDRKVQESGSRTFWKVPCAGMTMGW